MERVSVGGVSVGRRAICIANSCVWSTDVSYLMIRCGVSQSGGVE